MAAPDFIDRSPELIEAQSLATFEAALGKALLPAQPERLLVNAIVYREILTRIAAQQVAEQCLVNYATADRLEQLGALFGVSRLPAAPARVTLEFTRTGSTVASLLIPEGTRAAIAASGSLWFATLADATIPAGQTSITAEAEAIASGSQFNGYVAGEISQLVDLLPNVTITVANTTTSAGGLEAEDDERLRQRIKLAPNVFSTAGSEGSYIYHALSADPSIIDVAVVSPTPIRVNVYPLVSTGLPSTELLNKVAAAISGDRVRPLTDDARVEIPETISYAIQANVTLLSTADTQALDNQLQAAGEAFAQAKRQKLGLDIVRSQIIAALSLDGVYKVDLIEPSTDVELSRSQWANASSVTVNVVGVEEG
jgi:phage-related baseplate assembly protein